MLQLEPTQFAVKELVFAVMHESSVGYSPSMNFSQTLFSGSNVYRNELKEAREPQYMSFCIQAKKIQR
jgi:hypothetical protein